MPRPTEPATAGAALALVEHGAPFRTAAALVGISRETAHRIVRQAKARSNGQSFRLHILRRQIAASRLNGAWKREIVAALDELLTLRAAGRST